MDASSIEAASAFFSIPDDCAATVASWLRTEERTALAATSRTATALFRSSVASLRIVYDHLPRRWEGDDERRLLAGLSSLMRSLPLPSANHGYLSRAQDPRHPAHNPLRPAGHECPLTAPRSLVIPGGVGLLALLTEMIAAAELQAS